MEVLAENPSCPGEGQAVAGEPLSSPSLTQHTAPLAPQGSVGPRGARLCELASAFLVSVQS